MRSLNCNFCLPKLRYGGGGGGREGLSCLKFLYLISHQAVEVRLMDHLICSSTRSLIHSSDRYLLSTYYIPGPTLGAGAQQ